MIHFEKLELFENKMPSSALHIFNNNLFYFVLVLQFHIILDSKDVEYYVEPKQEQVVVRAVFINCETNEDQGVYPDNEATRFQREELYKHSSLQGCRKKLALTLKLSNEPENTSGDSDEYIPIEHVFDGSNKKRIRLLNPYILRIRRDAPLEAYKLRLMESVIGTIALSDDRKSYKNNHKKVRVLRESTDLPEESDGLSKSEISTSIELEPTKGLRESTTNNTDDSNGADCKSKFTLCFMRRDSNQLQAIAELPRENENGRDKREVRLADSPAGKRDKRNEHNIIVEDSVDDEKIPMVPKRLYQKPSHAREDIKIMDEKPTHDSKRFTKKIKESKDYYHSSEIINDNIDTHRLATIQKQEKPKGRKSNVADFTNKFVKSERRDEHVNRRDNENQQLQRSFSYDPDESNYALYEIREPELWYSVQVQLFEKMSTHDGKTAWNDITNGEIASVSSIEPQWKGQDITVKYTPTEWVTKDKFSLPSATNLGLLVSTHDEIPKSSDGKDKPMRRFIVVPMNDIVPIRNNGIHKRDENDSNHTSESPRGDQSPRKVLVRVSRALLTESDDDLRVSSQGSDRYLVMPYRRPHHAQIDLEARADDNELIRVGSSGSLNTIVTDSSRRMRSAIIVQATNKGLAAARFKIKTRDCGPELADLMEKANEQLMTDPVLIAPRHTHRYVLELPAEIPVDVAHCSVVLVNDQEESVAVREVAIRKGDRCFCVWHCDCVCLNEDPKLVCREMAAARQAAAGLEMRGRSRRARFACYPDILCINLTVVALGVIVALLMLGFVKAVSGLVFRCVGGWGLHRLIQTPRKLDHYYESSLRERPVVYDDGGWPVHPDTKKRTVRLVSREIEFALNIIFFVAVPSVMFWDAMKWLRCAGSQIKKDAKRKTEDTKKCFSSHDMQGKQRRWHRRRVDLQRWMTQPAEELTADLWDKGLNKPVENEFMLPLLVERQYKPGELSSCVDSEQDDTEYVLTQMQKSKESLAKSQRKINESGPYTGVPKQLNAGTNDYK